MRSESRCALIKGVGSDVMSTSVYTGLNLFNFIRKHFPQICLYLSAQRLSDRTVHITTSAVDLTLLIIPPPVLMQKRVSSIRDESQSYLGNVSVVPVVSQNACYVEVICACYSGSRHGPVRTGLGSRRNGQAAYTVLLYGAESFLRS